MGIFFKLTMVLLCLCGGMKTEFLEYNEVTVVQCTCSCRYTSYLDCSCLRIFMESLKPLLSKLLFILKYAVHGSEF